MGHLLAGLLVEQLYFLLFLVDDRHSVVLAIKSAIFNVLDKLAHSQGVLLAKVVQLARLREIELKQALVEIALLELVAQLQD